MPVSKADSHRATPTRPCGTGVLVLAGSSGRVDRGRADLLARHGADALAIRWFGGVEQRPAPHEVPLETFMGALDVLGRDCDRVAIIGTSFGAEAALLTAAHTDVHAVVACAPTSVAWAGYADRRWSSHWTWRGQPVRYLPLIADWSPATNPPAFRELYERSLDADETAASAATIPVEQITGRVVLAAGEDDQVWPSAEFARRIVKRRTAHGLATQLVIGPDAGHRMPLPGEDAPRGGIAMARGGTPEGDAELGRRLWPHIVAAFELH
jgi:dienelactone hydrolase